MKEVIEQFEPGAHQFIPFDLIVGSGNAQEVREYFTLIIGQFADLANLALSDVQWRKIKIGPDRTIDSWSKKTGVPMTFEREKLGEFHLWHTRKHKAMTCMSEELYRAIKEVCPMTGLQFEKQTLV